MESIFVPVHIGDEGRIEVARHPVEDGLRFQVDGKRVRHEARGTVDVMHVKRLRPGVDQAVLEWQLLGGNEGVDPIEVGPHGRLEFRNRGVGLDAFHGAFGGLAHAQGPQVLVVLDHVGAEQCGELSPSCPAQKVHLPQALHGVDVAQGMHGVGFRVRVDVRHGHVVKYDVYVVHDSVGGEVKPVIRGNGLGGDVDQRGQHRDHHGHHEQDVFHE